MVNCPTKSNRDLTQSEREAKRALKVQVKEQTLRNYWKRRIDFAIKCNDDVKLQRAREELRCLDEKRRERESVDNGLNDESLSRGKKFIERVYDGLIHPKFKKGRADTSLSKHMRKGTQELSMFDNVDALWGYTKLKFRERATCVISSISKLREDNHQEFLSRLQSLSKVCSIGSGPGNDAVGILSFLRSFGNVPATKPCLEYMAFLDMAGKEWQVVTDRLDSILVPNHIQRLDVRFCDVTESIQSAPNRDALETVRHGQFDMFLVSYVLTETHGQWETFMLEVIEMAKSGTLFYFAEPRPWQLHRLAALCQSSLTLVWIDSSMHIPSLQALGTRVGPAILLGMKQ